MRRDRQRLEDMLEALDWIAETVANRTEESFVADKTLRYAVAQQLTIVGEAAARLTQEFKARHAGVVWTDVVALRNILGHHYFGVHWPVIWQSAVEDAPVLRAQVAEILAAESLE